MEDIKQIKCDCTVLVNSCDAYEDTWVPFFTVFEKQWPECPYPIVLNTESKSFAYKNMDIKTFSFYEKTKNVEWGERLIKTLKAIDTEYVVFLLDDFFFLKPVDQKRLDECKGWMDKDKNISVFSFWRTHQPNIQDCKYPHFEKRPQKAEYRLNCQAALWRREKLISYIRPTENPWIWEIYGSKRSSRYKEDFYSAIEDEPYVFTYSITECGIVRGKWAEGVKDLFKEYNISCDFDKRGFVEKNNNIVGVASKKNILQKIYWQLRVIHGYIRNWRSFI